MDRHMEAVTLTLAHADPRLLLVHAVLGQAWGAGRDRAATPGRGAAPQAPAALSYVLRRPAPRPTPTEALP